MIFQSDLNPNSHLTVKERLTVSFPTRFLFENGFIKGNVLDFGCGLGADMQYLKGKGVSVEGYDPHYQPHYPKGAFDTIICQYVLNVLLPEEQSQVLMRVSELLKPNGKAYFTVRRDIKNNGFIFNPKRNVKVYQCNVILPYPSVLLKEHCEIYEYEHLNKKWIDSECQNCNPILPIFTESAMAYAVLHNTENQITAHIIPKNHFSSYFQLSPKEQTALWMVVSRVKDKLREQTGETAFKVTFCSYENEDAPHFYISLTPSHSVQ